MSSTNLVGVAGSIRPFPMTVNWQAPLGVQTFARLKVIDSPAAKVLAGTAALTMATLATGAALLVVEITTGAALEVVVALIVVLGALLMAVLSSLPSQK